ncbi:MAG: cupin domain-containing protein [Dehalococcoidia bacterium]|nr:cupin domain-containing protein [Dehalococcoidia bacterium]
MVSISERYEPWTLTPYEKWVSDEGLAVHTQQLVPDINTIEVANWERTGTKAALLDLTGEPLDGALVNNQGTIRFVCDIPPGGSFKLERHMYEEIFFVVKGRGATAVWYEGTPKHTFEWQTGSVFSIPLNSWHEIYNASGDETARLYGATNAPTAFNLYGSPEFIFDCPMTFPDRFDPNDELYFSGKSTKLEDRFMETNFIPNVYNVNLDRWTARGPGANMMINMANGHFICHLSEFPAGTYKKAHTSEANRKKAGLVSDVAYLFLSGDGYDLQWPEGVYPSPGTEWEQLSYKAGTLMSPGPGYHQHFNCSAEPIRYLVLRYGNPRFAGYVGTRYKETGGPQIQFKEEDPAIRLHFEKELASRGAVSHMENYGDEP